jgi:hypothetical protein
MSGNPQVTPGHFLLARRTNKSTVEPPILTQLGDSSFVRYGSKAEVTARHVEVCFTPETGHRLTNL